jgi:hypothetical protein
MFQLRPDIFGAGEPVFMMKVPEVAGSFFFFVQIPQRDVQPHRAITQAS